MDAVKFLKEWNRMCLHTGCHDCQIKKEVRNDLFCLWIALKQPKDVVSTVEKWSAKHPIKTRESEFLKMFPNARLNECGSIAICPRIVDASFDSQECERKNCPKCEKDYWGAEVK